jgi:hypothetical protein
MEKTDRIPTAAETAKARGILRRANTQAAMRYGKGGLKTSRPATRKVTLASTPWDNEKQK